MSGLGSRSTAEQVTDGIDLAGRHAVVTGANTGIGYETARVLALRGAQVTLACRNPEKAESARDRIVAGAGADPSAVGLLALDLASLASVRDAAAKLLEDARPIHLLINNAGVMLPERRETADGFEAHFGINHLGHFLFTNLLLERIRASAPARIVNVSSAALSFATLGRQLEDLNWETRSFSGWRSYGDSKLMNVLFARELTRRYGDEGVVAHALHPGMVKTELARDQAWWMLAVGLLAFPFMKSPERGAATTLHAATSAELASGESGYFADCAAADAGKSARDEELARRLWEHSEKLVAT